MIKISGIVVRGSRRGHELGFPTANIELKEKIKSGVYAGRVFLGRKKYKAAVFVRKDRNILEAHLLNFSKNLYDKEITIELGPRIRGARNFKSDRDIVTQINKDIDLARRA